MFEQFLIDNATLLGDPWIFAIALFLLIITQIFGAFFNPMVLIVAPFIPAWLLVIIVTIVGSLGESVNYLMGHFFSDFFRKRFPKVIKTMNEYTSFSTVLLARFTGVPLLSHALGIGDKLSYREFLAPTALFFLINTSIMAILGNTIPLRFFPVLLGLFVIFIGYQGLSNRKK